MQRIHGRSGTACFLSPREAFDLERGSLGSYRVTEPEAALTPAPETGGVTKAEPAPTAADSSLPPSSSGSLLSPTRIAELAAWLSARVGRLLAGVFGALINAVLMLFIMFYFFKDGPDILRSVQNALPLDNAYQERVVFKFKKVSMSMIRGVVATALAQGCVAAVLFSFFGFRPLFWGSLVAFSALIPLVGTTLVTVPLTIYLLLHHDHGVLPALLFAGVAALIASLDNILRPLLLKDGLSLHPVWILLAILGGVGTFGPLGLILGPMVVVLLRTALAMMADASSPAVAQGGES